MLAIRWLMGVLMAMALAGCGSGEAVSGSPRITPGSYSGAEDWDEGLLAPLTIPLVAVVVEGNYFAYSDVGAPGGAPYNGMAALPPAVDDDGRFTVQVAQGTFGSGFIPAGVFSGRNTPKVTPQLSGRVSLATGDSAAWDLTLQPGQGHVLEGLYLGDFSAPESGPVILLVGGDGMAILLRGPAEKWVETAVGTADAGTGALTFDKTNPGRTLAGTIAGGVATGTYTFSDVGSGTWSATKQ